MITYKAMHKYLDEAVHGEVLAFPGVITCGRDLSCEWPSPAAPRPRQHGS